MDIKGLYIHIPFCLSKCFYCDFNSGPCGPVVISAYMDSLFREMEQKAKQHKGNVYQSLFVGGGTPTVLSPEGLSLLLDRTEKLFSFSPDAEMTIEANPGTVTSEKAAVIGSSRINRVSLGCQSFNEDELKALGRIHGPGEAGETVRLLRKNGIDNINLDLMYGIPLQTMKSWMNTLDEALSLHPRHISAYQLKVEEGTPFAAMQERGELVLPDEDEILGMQRYVRRFLEVFGFERYEISNYACPGFRSFHNMLYWKMESWLGLGLGASSWLAPFRTENTADMDEYRKGSFAEPPVRLSAAEMMEEYAFMSLRTSDGLDCTEFRRRFGKVPEEVFREALEFAGDNGLMEKKASSYVLTARGFELGNLVFEKFIL